MRRALVLVLVLVSACVQSSEVACGDGRTCPPGNTCNDTLHTCVSPEQTAACAGLHDDDPCVISTIAGVCSGGVCAPLLCGDGVRTVHEACDGLDLGGADCTTAGFYDGPGLACTSFCTFDTRGCTGMCGDGLVNADELCDGAPPAGTCFADGFDAGTLGCSGSCGASFRGCARFGFQPQQTGVNALSAFAARSEDDAWAVGRVGADAMISHYDGQSWTTVTTVPGILFEDLATAAAGELWLAVDRTVPSAVQLFHLHAGVVAAVGDAPTTQLRGVFSLAAGQVYLATADAGVLHFDGASWHPLGALATPVARVRGSASNDLWAIGVDGSLAHWTGAAWTPTPLAASIADVDALAADDAWAVGTGAGFAPVVARWDGASWTVVPTRATPQLISVVANADNDVWVAVADGEMMHFDGHAWIASVRSVTAGSSPSHAFLGLAKLGGGRLAAATTDGFAYRYSGQVYGGGDTGTAARIGLLWGAGPDELFAGDLLGRILHYDGNTWTKFQTGGTYVTAITGISAQDVWAASSGTSDVLHWDGTSWTAAFELSGVDTMWASGPGEVWATVTGSIWHWDGSSATSSLSTEATQCLVDGTSAVDVWGACGANVYHWTGTSWSAPIPVPQPFDPVVTAIRAIGPHELMVAAGSRIAHFDGTTWTNTALPAPGALTLLSSTAPDDVFAANTEQLFHFDGRTWTPVARPNDAAVVSDSIVALFAQPGVVDLIMARNTVNEQRRLIRTRPWNCRAHETSCHDGVDDDCDGLVDDRDPDCI